MRHTCIINPIRYILLSLSLALIALTMKAAHEVSRANAAAKPNKPMPSLQGQPAIDYLKQSGLFESVKAAVEADRHMIQRLPGAGRPGAGGVWQANNPGQIMQASFSRDGALITPRQSCAGDFWQVALKLRGVGYGERLSNVTQGPMRASGNRIEYAHSLNLPNPHSAFRLGRNPQLTEWYVNKPEGIEQGFTLAESPGVSSGKEPLRVALTVTGGLQASLADDGQAVALAYRDGRQALRYDHLAAYDKLGRWLPARMEVSEDNISLLVDDANAVYPVTVDLLFTEIKKLTASDGAEVDQFGTSVAISGDTAIVGANNNFGNNKGSVYVFERNKGGANLWGEVKKLTASDGMFSDAFGASVAISGDTAIVGAFFPNSNNKGSAYVFERNKGGADNWGEVKKLTASDGAAGNRFGYSVAISGDKAIVGASGFRGGAYVFERNKGGADNWGEVKKLTASAYSVAISGDTAIAGESILGGAYVFERNKGGADNWGEVKKLTASDGAAAGGFGESVAISGDTAIVGAYTHDNYKGAAYIFERNKGGANLWGEVKKLTASDGASPDAFGLSVALSGNTAIIGANSHFSNKKGSAYVFERNKGGANLWGEVKKLTASDGMVDDEFGISVAISGCTVIVGAVNKGSAYIFVCEASSLANVSAASFLGAELAAESIVAAFGVNLATSVESANTTPLPTTLAGTKVTVKDSAGLERLSPLFFVAPSQVNYQIPAGTTNGAATVTITSSDGKTSVGVQQIASVAPGLFTANANGLGVPAATVFRLRANGTTANEPTAQFDSTLMRFVPLPIDLGPEGDQVFVVLFGTGFRNNTGLPSVSVKIGGVDSQVLYAGITPGFVGLDQSNARIPRSLAGRGEVDLVMTVNGKVANTVRISIK